ncbi:MAG: minichromosome maintenance protein MCM [Thermoproteota archaeon]|nr:minichromosome maintenance protein MCM [Candidatus Brockarchaeota archaeon]MBO3767744.1 minichromosome maintenance protein MCM [Candidatus Brockarchaeota archaeon]MBO3800726.1 minichromosome maintenance protein MCM [Candidatus Brockarchaeota archaeon]
MEQDKTESVAVLFSNFIRGFTNNEGKFKYLDAIISMPINLEKSIVVSFEDMLIFDSKLCEFLEKNPSEAIKQFEEAALMILTEHDVEYAKKIKKVRVRISGYPQSVTIRDLNSSFIGKIVKIEGVVVRQSQVKTQLVEGTFRCLSCGTLISVEQNSQSLTLPKTCPACNANNPSNFELDPSKSVFDDFQMISIQEKPESLPAGQIPQTIDLNLTGDLTNKVRPGDRVKITGIVGIRYAKSVFGKPKSKVFELSLEVNNIEIETEESSDLILSEEQIEKFKKDVKDPLFYRKLVSSVAPSIHGLDHIKEAILLQLVGGVPKQFKDGIRVRGDINILLVGDPGTGKSQLLKYAQRIAPRGLYTSGRGATAAGLTAAAVRDESGTFMLEAGALVLADKGLAAIDEFEKMREEDRVAIHEALEQQTCSIAKGGIVATLNARTAVLAAANPQLGRYDPNRSFYDNISLSSTILSRFDLYFILRDVPNPSTDEELVTHILAQHRYNEVIKEEIFDINYLRKFIAHAKTIEPKLSKDAEATIKTYFLSLRSASSSTSLQITPRQLESLIRLSEARAKLMLRSEVLKEDAEVAIRLYKISMEQVGIDMETGQIDVDAITGKPRSTREKMSTIMSICDQLENEFGSAPVEEVLKRCEEKGIDKNDARRLINQLLRDGIFYSPDDKSLKRVR